MRKCEISSRNPRHNYSTPDKHEPALMRSISLSILRKTFLLLKILILIIAFIITAVVSALILRALHPQILCPTSDNRSDIEFLRLSFNHIKLDSRFYYSTQEALAYIRNNPGCCKITRLTRDYTWSLHPSNFTRNPIAVEVEISPQGYLSRTGTRQKYEVQFDICGNILEREY